MLPMRKAYRETASKALPPKLQHARTARPVSVPLHLDNAPTGS